MNSKTKQKKNQLPLFVKPYEVPNRVDVIIVAAAHFPFASLSVSCISSKLLYKEKN